ncbi:regulatory protein RecX [Sphingomonas daechungensis]|uniref:Regulatory protein RecX n=2 Tax=Sphingomonas daechungensis TaxID=1176646 RepID=A0ABX6TA36_9SPHN|nr:RecX family transcriptional regulator [Sphingomonas daechungensis]
MHVRRSARPRKPLNGESLHELALFYVGKFATTRAKLVNYLNRKVRERGWDGDREPEIETLVERIAASGLVDDALYAMSKSRLLSERGYGGHRVAQALRAAGIDEEDGAAAQNLAAEEAARSALRFARRRHLGPFADVPPDRNGREKALAAMIRAGHRFELAKAVIDAEPGSEPDLNDLQEKSR